METGRVIYRRYLLRRLIKQGQNCAVYQGVDQVLQRPVAVKSVSASHSSAYRSAIRLTAQFSHPNIVGLYDVVSEGETLYIVQEYVEGDSFSALLQAHLSPYDIADVGYQVCQALIYAGAASRRACHGDLTPAAILRDRQEGLVRVNNFALPSDLYYFNSWSILGGDGAVVSSQELPWGQLTEARREDDARAVGLLLYQLLAGCQPGAVSVDPPADGRLRFMRNIPPELCETIARVVIRQHPQHIATPEALATELKTLMEILEPPAPVPTSGPGPYKPEELVRVKPFSSPPIPMTPGGGTGKLVSALPTGGEAGRRLGSYRAAAQTEASPAAAAVADVSLKLAAARQAAYGAGEQAQSQKSPMIFPLLLLVGLLVFGLFFAIGYFVSNLIIR
ncbi:MAG: protein kinase [Chloroflexota bacterium]|nr:protein kinase [Chloroflexota bacterium]